MHAYIEKVPIMLPTSDFGGFLWRNSVKSQPIQIYDNHILRWALIDIQTELVVSES